jgi:hypothetical protein
MNLIQITEQLKNPAVSVQQLMQYANNSNPQVPSYVALAEMQRRQSIQAPPQAPQQTVKDQLGSQLMGLPSVAPAGAPAAPAAAPGAAPGAAPIPQPPTQQASQPAPPPEQVPMPEPKQALPNPPGMAGGGLTSIPLNMHHDFAAGGIIAFAGGGDTDLAAQYPEQTTLEQERAERLKNQEVYGFGGDPYAEAKRRYSDLEKRQLEREKSAGADRFWAGLSTLASSGTRGFGESMGMAMKTAQDLEDKQKTEGDAQRAKMAELSTLWGKEQDALNRANYAADKGNMNEKREQLLKAANYRLERQKAEASTTSAEASAQNARTLEKQREFEQSNYPAKLKIEQDQARAQLISASKNPAEVQIAQGILADMKRSNPNATLMDAYQFMQTGKGAGKTGVLTQDQLLDSWEKMPLQERMQRVKAAGGDILKARNDYIKSNGGLSSLQSSGSTGGRKPSDMSNEELLKALGR